MVCIKENFTRMLKDEDYAKVFATDDELSEIIIHNTGSSFTLEVKIESASNIRKAGGF